MGINDFANLAAVDMMSLGIIGLVFILLIVFSVLSAKTWHWINIVFLNLTFIAGVAAIWGLTQVYHHRTKDIANFQNWEKRAEEAKAAADEAIYGPRLSPTYAAGSLRAVSEELGRQMAGQGDVWPGGQVAADGEERVFTFAAPRTDDARSLQDNVLYAFLERPIGDQLHPAVYIGTVRVESESPASLKLSPVALAEPGQFAEPTATWALYERMPLDRRGTFKQATISYVENNPESAGPELIALVENLKDENADLDITAFRNNLMNGHLPAQQMGFEPDSEEYEELIDRYAFDGLSIGTIQNWINQNATNRKNTRFDPPPEEVFVRYRFDKRANRPYQVDANGSVETQGLFTPLGAANDPSLHAGGEGTVLFSQGDEVLVDQRTAVGYQRDDLSVAPFDQLEPVTEIDRIYIRQVRDFPYEFADLRIQAEFAVEEAAKVTANNLIQDVTLADARTQLAERDRLLADLDSDNTHLKNDLDTINSLVEQKTQQIEQLAQEVASLQSTIQDAYSELRRMAVIISKKAFAGN